MRNSFEEFCDLAKIEIDQVLNEIRLDSKTGSDFVSSKAAASPVVTEIDLMIETRLRGLIDRKFPNAAILGEEFSNKAASNGDDQRFILDPIDGTIALLTGKPTYASLIGLQQGNQFHSGWVYLPALNQCYSASKAAGSIGPQGNLYTTQKNDLSQVIWSTTTPHMFSKQWQKELISELHDLCWLSSYGGDAMQYCLLAQGRIDLIIEDQMEIHDYAAVVPIVQEAGGCVTDFDGKPLNPNTSNGEVLASANPTLHEIVLSLIREVRSNY